VIAAATTGFAGPALANPVPPPGDVPVDVEIGGQALLTLSQ
jgi:hypothetical protein